MEYIIVITIAVVILVCSLNGEAKKNNIEKQNNYYEKYIKDNSVDESNVISWTQYKEEMGIDYELETKLIIDKQKKKIYIFKINEKFNEAFDSLEPNILNFDDILEFALLEDNNTLTSGGVGRAVVGAAIAGGVGAIVGATTRKSNAVVNNLSIRISTSNIDDPMVMITVFDCDDAKPLKRDSDYYRYLYEIANKIYSTLVAIINQKNKN